MCAVSPDDFVNKICIYMLSILRYVINWLELYFGFAFSDSFWHQIELISRYTGLNTYKPKMIHVHVNKEIKFCRLYVYFLNCFQKIRSTCIHIHVHVFIWNNKTKYFTSTFELCLEILVRLKKHATYDDMVLPSPKFPILN